MKLNLFHELCDFKYIAIIAQKILRKEGVPPNIAAFREDLTMYNWAPPRRAQIPKPRSTKKRDIFIFNDKDSFLQKVITEILTTKFKYKIHEDVFSYTKGLRTFDGAKHIQEALRKKKLFGLKVDISNYFMNVSTPSIYKAIDELIEDADGRKLLKDLFSLNKFYQDNELHYEPLGIMPGCALSSFFANYLLSDIDEYLHNNAFVYARYSDDLIFFTEDKELLDTLLNNVIKLLAAKGLTINPNKVYYFNRNEPIDFLGLEITKDYIDINEDTFYRMKSLIKTICKKQRRKAEQHELTHDKYVVQNTLKIINRLLYKSCLSKANAHKSNRLVYIFANITSIKSLKKLDFYICDSLRYVYTGKHNKGNYKYLSTKDLEELGFYSTVKAFNLFKISKDLFLTKVYSLGRSVKPPKFTWEYFKPCTEQVSFKPSNFKDFYSLYLEILKKGYFIINNREVPAQSIVIDPVKGEIKILDFSIMKGSSYVVDNFKFYIGEEAYIQSVVNLPLLNQSSHATSQELYNLYLQGVYTQNTSCYLPSPTDCSYLPYFRTLSFEKLILYFSNVELSTEEPPVTRYLKFLVYLYCHIFSGNLWQDLDYTKPFLIIGKANYALALKTEWLLRSDS